VLTAGESCDIIKMKLRKGATTMTKKEFTKSVTAEVAELLKVQLDMSLTEGARANAHAELVSLMTGSAEKAWEMFDFS